MYAALAQMGIGAIQAGISASKAANLPDPKKHVVGPEMRLAYNMARRRADEGYSPEERAQFEQMLARQGTSAKRMMQNVGLAGVGSAAANIMGIDALNQFAAKGADIKRQNFGQFAGLAGQVQGIQDMEVGRFNQQLNMESQALGQATSSGIGNMFGGLNAAQNFGQQNKVIDAWNNMGQNNTNINTNAPSQNQIGAFGGGQAGFNLGQVAPTQNQQAQPFQMNQPFQGSGMNMFTNPQAPPLTPQVNQPFQGYGMNMFSPQQNQPQINQPFQGFGMGMFQ